MIKDRNIRILNKNEFPLCLQESIYAPEKLHVLGTLKSDEYFPVALVGTRRVGANAEVLCQKLVQSLKGTKAIVVSGLAQGVDYFCHKAAIENNIPTIAVLGQGLCTPIEGSRGVLAQKILEAGGALVSQFENSTPAYRGNFIARNKIISGLSQAVVIVQSKLKGGALLTVDFARSENKKIIAIPGNFDSEVYSGTNKLLDEEKALPLFNPQNLYQKLGLLKADNFTFENFSHLGGTLTGDAFALLKKYNGFKVSITELQLQSGFQNDILLTILTELELSGLVSTEDNFHFYFHGDL